MLGGPGVDKAVFSERAAPLVLTLDNVANDGETGEADDVQMDVENVDGGQAGDTIVGSALANALNGAGGNDDLDGGAGADSLVGGDGIDAANFAARGRRGHGKARRPGQRRGVRRGRRCRHRERDRRRGKLGPTTISRATTTCGDNGFAGGGGNDDARGAGGNDSLDGGTGENYLDGGSGADSYAAGASGDVFRSRDGIADTLACQATTSSWRTAPTRLRDAAASTST